MGSLILHCWWKRAHCLGHVSRAPGWRGPDFISFTNKITKKKKRYSTDICVWLTASSCYRVRMLKRRQRPSPSTIISQTKDWLPLHRSEEGQGFARRTPVFLKPHYLAGVCSLADLKSAARALPMGATSRGFPATLFEEC